MSAQSTVMQWSPYGGAFASGGLLGIRKHLFPCPGISLCRAAGSTQISSSSVAGTCLCGLEKADQAQEGSAPLLLKVPPSQTLSPLLPFPAHPLLSSSHLQGLTESGGCLEYIALRSQMLATARRSQPMCFRVSPLATIIELLVVLFVPETHNAIRIGSSVCVYIYKSISGGVPFSSVCIYFQYITLDTTMVYECI